MPRRSVLPAALLLLLLLAAPRARAQGLDDPDGGGGGGSLSDIAAGATDDGGLGGGPESGGTESGKPDTGLPAPVPMGARDQCAFDAKNDKGATLHYDLSGLKGGPKGDGKEDFMKTIQVGPNIQFVYRMNLCADTTETCQNEPSPATEALKIPAGETCRILGRLSDPSDPIASNHATYELVPGLETDPAKNPYGVDLQITYNNGDLCDPAKQTMRSVSIHLVCDLTLKESEFADVKKEATCNTQYIMNSALACPTGGGGAGSASHMLTLALIGFAAYILVGVAVMRFYYKEEWGMGVIPNRTFWTDVPSLAKEGCTYSYQKVKEMKGGMSGGGGGGGGGGNSSGYSGSSAASTYGSGTPPADVA